MVDQSVCYIASTHNMVEGFAVHGLTSGLPFIPSARRLCLSNLDL